MRGFTFIKFTTCFLAFSLFAAPVMALEQKDADALKTVLTRNVSDIATHLRANGGDLKQTGAVKAELKGSYIAASYPDLTVVNPAKHMTDIGAIAVNAAPAPTAGQWLLSYAFPMPIITYDAKGAESSRITFGTQDVRGTYDDKAKIYTNSDVALQNIVIIPSGGKEEIKIASFTMNHDLKNKQGGLVDARMQGNMNGLTFPAALTEKFAAAILLPTKFGFAASSTNMAQNDVMAIQQEVASAKTPEARSAAGQKLIALYQKHGTEFEVTDLSMSGADYSIKFTGRAKAIQGAVAGFSLNGKVTIKGLQAIQTKLAELPTKDQKEKETLMKASAGLLMMQGYLQKGSGDEFTLDMSMDKDGKVMVNGVDRTADLGRMIQGAAGGAAGRGAKAASGKPAI